MPLLFFYIPRPTHTNTHTSCLVDSCWRPQPDAHATVPKHAKLPCQGGCQGGQARAVSGPFAADLLAGTALAASGPSSAHSPTHTARVTADDTIPGCRRAGLCRELWARPPVHMVSVAARQKTCVRLPVGWGPFPQAATVVATLQSPRCTRWHSDQAARSNLTVLGAMAVRVDAWSAVI